MDYIFITLVTNTKQYIDLKVPDFVAVKDLLVMLSEALDIKVLPSTKIQAEPVGRILDNLSTLEASGVSNGALLTMI